MASKKKLLRHYIEEVDTMISSKKSKQEVTGVLFLEATLQMCKINIEASSSSLEFGQPSSRVLDLEFESSGLW